MDNGTRTFNFHSSLYIRPISLWVKIKLKWNKFFFFAKLIHITQMCLYNWLEWKKKEKEEDKSSVACQTWRLTPLVESFYDDVASIIYLSFVWLGALSNRFTFFFQLLQNIKIKTSIAREYLLFTKIVRRVTHIKIKKMSDFWNDILFYFWNNNIFAVTK